jgi:hypothetical protein
VKVALLREQDFGSYEGRSFVERARGSRKSGKDVQLEAHKNDPGFKDVESKEAMKARADRFVEEYMVGLFNRASDARSVVIVSHGIILAHLWRCILSRFQARNVSMAPGLEFANQGMTLEYISKWSNTGYLELELRPRVAGIQTGIPPAAGAVVEPAPVPLPTASKIGTPRLLDMLLVVKAVNSLEHLKGLKKTRGGIGSSKHDEGQKTMESFFKKRKIG